jgi:hypothetical protein
MKNYILQIILIISCSLYSQEYIQIIKPDINIRMLPSTSSPIVGHAFAEEIYIMNGETNNWYSVLLPSGETRWIYKRLAKKVNFNDELKSNWNLAQIQEDIKLATDQANQDANEEIIDDLNKVQINNILFDRYVLIVLQDYGVSPVYYQLIIDYVKPKIQNQIRESIAEHMVSVSHIDYDLFKIDDYNFYIETRRCFKLGNSLDAMIYMYYEDDYFVQKLCFEIGYGKGFENCYNIKNIYSSVLEESNLVVLTTDGKMKKSNLILKESQLELPNLDY